MKKINPKIIERKREMQALRDKGWTLDKIGVNFGVSRERVRQLIGNTGFMKEKNRLNPSKGSSLLDAKELIKNTELTTPQFKKLKGVNGFVMSMWGKVRHETNNAMTRKGFAVEEYVSKKLTSLGIGNKLTNSRPVDIVLDNGKTIEVKSRYKPENNSDSEDFYLFQLARSLRSNPDFFILCIVALGEKYLFVIPREDIPSHGGVGFVYPKPDKNVSDKWRAYQDRFDLLKG